MYFVYSRYLYVHVCMCVYVCKSESEHGLDYLLWILFICNVITPNETQCHHSQQFGSVYPRNRTIGLRSVVFQLCVCYCFFINILKDYFTVSVYSHYCPNDCREVVMNFSKQTIKIYHNAGIKGIAHQRLGTVNHKWKPLLLISRIGSIWCIYICSHQTC